MTKLPARIGYRYVLWRAFSILALLLLMACEGAVLEAPVEAPVETPVEVPVEIPANDAPVAASLLRLEISPATATLAAGTQLSLHVTGLYGDGSRSALAQSVTWLSNDSNAVSVDALGRLSGVTAKSSSTGISASFEGISVEVPVEVTAALLTRIEIDPASPLLPAGTLLPLSATGLFSDGSRQSLDDQVSWRSDNTRVFTVSADNQLQALAVGSGMLRATLNGVFGQTAVSVTDAKLTALRVSPASAKLPAGTQLSLTVLGLYSDGSQQDLTQRAQWLSSDTATASLQANKLLGVSAGNATAQVSVDGLSLTIPLSVSAAVLASLELVVGAGDLPAGLTRSLRAMGHFSDGSLQDLSAQVVWRSSDDSVLNVANASGDEGLATGLTPGAVTVSASLGDVRVSTSVAVSRALLQSLELEPVTPHLAAGTELMLTAIGRYSDGSVRELNQRVSWSSGDSATATVANGGEQPGLLAGLVQGQTTISVRLGSVTANLPVVVSAATLLAIDISPASISLAAGARIALQAVGSFSDGSTQPLNAVVNWESSHPDTATVDAQGNFQAVAVGNANLSYRLSASYGGVTGGVPFTVTDATLLSLAISPANAALASGTQIAFSLEATYSDNSRQDVTAQAVWDSTDTQVLNVSNGAASRGVVSGGTPGTATVRARLQGVESTRSVTVNNAVLTGLRMSTPKTDLASGEALQLQVFADFSDNSSQLLGREAVWGSDDVTLASVGNAEGSRGRVVAGDTKAGTVRITATHAGLTVEQLLAVTLDSQRPVSMVVLPGPNVLLNDGVDSSRIVLRLLAADARLTVADGTLVDVNITLDGVLQESQTAVANAGEAVVNFTTTASGLLEIVANVQGSEVVARSSLYAGKNVLAVALPAAFVDAPSNNGVVLAGARFGFYLFNTSNRDFPLDAFVFRNGADVLANVTDPAQLNAGWLGGGDKFGVTLKFSADVVDQGLNATYFLRDPSTDKPVTYQVVYTQP